jgi:hypothetical protein
MGVGYSRKFNRPTPLIESPERKQMVGSEGIEPSTCGLKVRCSTAELRARLGGGCDQAPAELGSSILPGCGD